MPSQLWGIAPYAAAHAPIRSEAPWRAFREPVALKHLDFVKPELTEAQRVGRGVVRPRRIVVDDGQVGINKKARERAILPIRRVFT